MTLFATNAAALFVPRDSPLSQVELLTQDSRQDRPERRGIFSRDKHSSKDTPDLEHELGEHQRDMTENATTPTDDIVVASSATLKGHSSLQWVSLRSHEELEWHLSVCTHTLLHGFGFCLYSWCKG